MKLLKWLFSTESPNRGDGLSYDEIPYIKRGKDGKDELVMSDSTNRTLTSDKPVKPVWMSLGVSDQEE